MALKREKGSVPNFVIIFVLIIALIFGVIFYLGFISKNGSTLPGPAFAPSPEPSTATPSEAPVPIGSLPKPVSLAKQDLAARLNIDPVKINVIGLTRMDWPDASLGCPKEGMMYAQVVTSGYKAILTYNQVEYEYHTNLDNQFTKCQNPAAN